MGPRNQKSMDTKRKPVNYERSILTCINTLGFSELLTT
jgi:hypothetical protein